MRQSNESMRVRVLDEIHEVNKRYLYLIRDLYGVSSEEAVARSGLPAEVCHDIAQLSGDQIEELAHPGVLECTVRVSGGRFQRRVHAAVNRDGRGLRLQQVQSMIMQPNARG